MRKSRDGPEILSWIVGLASKSPVGKPCRLRRTRVRTRGSRRAAVSVGLT